jgi:TolB protein
VEAQDGATAAESASEPGPTGVEATKIAFARGLDLWLTNPDGTGSERLTKWKEAGKILPDDGRPVSWSPDGTRIAFVGWDDEDGAHIYTLKGDGTDLVRLTRAARGDYVIRSCPVWSPDGTRIAFSEEDYVYVIDVDGTGLRRLGRPASTGGGLPCPVWSPDGGRIAFLSLVGHRFHVSVTNADGTEPRRFGSFSAFADGNLQWSPDGTEVVLSHSGLEPEPGLYAVDVESGATRLLLPGALLTGGMPGSEWETKWVDAVFSPDGSRLALVRAVTEWRRVDRGRRGLHCRIAGGRIDIFTMNSDGSDLTQLTHHPKSDSFPTWSPDGTRIAFVRGLPKKPGSGQVYVMNADGSEVTRLTRDPRSHSPVWSPVSQL